MSMALIHEWLERGLIPQKGQTPGAGDRQQICRTGSAETQIPGPGHRVTIIHTGIPSVQKMFVLCPVENTSFLRLPCSQRWSRDSV